MTTSILASRRTAALSGLRSLAAVAVLAIVLPGQAAAAHWDRPSCYIDVHDGCFNNTNHPCTDEEYQGFLENCDTAYPNKPIRPTRGPKTLKFN
jgi:hypothetical protein